VTWWRPLAVLLCIVTALVSSQDASASSGVHAENRVRGFDLVAPTLVGLHALQGAEKHWGNSVAYDEMPSGYSLAAEGAASVATRFGVAVQEASPAAQAALGEARAGATLFRQGAFGVQETTGGQFWSLSNPAATPGFAGRLGLPGGAAPQVDWIMGGTLRSGASAITRGAPGIGVNIGGAMEIVTEPGGVGGLWFVMP
jgi:hypothetical protein